MRFRLCLWLQILSFAPCRISTGGYTSRAFEMLSKRLSPRNSAARLLSVLPAVSSITFSSDSIGDRRIWSSERTIMPNSGRCFARLMPTAVPSELPMKTTSVSGTPTCRTTKSNTQTASLVKASSEGCPEEIE